jgi:membrane protease YdiL (CAAX protease family)
VAFTPDADFRLKGAAIPVIAAPWKWLFDTGVSKRRYILRAALLSVIPSLAIAFALEAAGAMKNTPLADELSKSDPAFILGALLIGAPVLESLALAGILWLLHFRIRSPLKLASASAVIWALLHLPNGLAIPLVVVWPFFVFSCAYLAWRPKGWWRAMAVIISIHFLQNLLPALVLVLGT